MKFKKNKQMERLTPDEIQKIIAYAQELAEAFFGHDAKKYYQINPFGIKPDAVSLRQSQSVLRDTREILVEGIKIGLKSKQAQIAMDTINQYIPDRAFTSSKLEQTIKEIEAITLALQAKIRYTGDNILGEFIKEACSTLFFANGDCDDVVLLGAVMLGLNGHHFQVLLAGEKEFTHIFLRAVVVDNATHDVIYLAIDPTNKKQPAGWTPPFKKYMVLIDSRRDISTHSKK